MCQYGVNMKKLVELCLVLMAGFLLTSTRPITVQEKYMDRYKVIAMNEMKRSGIPASVKMAQGIMESMAGRSELAVQANNHFGIKCKSTWNGDTYLYKDDDRDSAGTLVHSCFRLYPSAEDSYYDHSEFLKNRSRYNSLFELAITDYVGWANGLKKCGYATDPSYSNKIIQTIEKYNLYVLDQEVIKSQLVPVKTEEELVAESIKSVEAEARITTATHPVAIKSPLPLHRPSVKPGIPAYIKKESSVKSKGKRKKLYK